MRGLVRLAVVVWLIGLGWALPAGAQGSTDDVLRAVQRAMSSGDAQALSRMAEPRVDVAIFGMQTLYSQAQTAYVMRAFFRDHPPEQFVIQRTVEDNGTWLATGRYWNRGDAHPYRITFVLRKRGGQLLIRSIRIEQSR